jgi:hypothetical protein
MIAQNTVPTAGRLSERTRWLIHFLILCTPVFLGALLFREHHSSGLPQNGFQLTRFILGELVMWGITFAAAFRLSRITARQLGLVTDRPWRAIACGVGWFIAIRIVILLLFLVQAHWMGADASGATQQKMFEVAHADTIAKHPGFSFAVFGIVSLIAGFSEELWRVGMLRGLGGLFPRLKGSRAGTYASIVVVSLIFGLGHRYEGWFGMENAAVLGILLGLILALRRSYWEIATAHVLFDLFAFGVIALFALNPSVRNAQIVYCASRGDIPKIKY